MTYQHIETLTAHHPLPPLARTVFALAVTLLKWEQRQQTRRALRKLDPHMLADIGMSANDARIECKKAFWRG